MSLKEDPHFEQVVDEIKDIQSKVDSVLFGSVFLRKPKGIDSESQVPSTPEETPDLVTSAQIIEEQMGKAADLEDRVKGMLDDQSTASYEDQIEDYLRDLEEIEKILRALKPILNPDSLRDGETGKTDVSWLSYRRQTLGAKLHKEILDLQEITEIETQDKKELEIKLKAVESLVKTANTLQQAAQYLAWFNRKVVQYNESLPEFERDFTTGLVSQWVQEEANKVLEHHNNCMNVRSELENKIQQQASD